MVCSEKTTKHPLNLRFISEPDLESRQAQGILYLKKAAEQGHELAMELLGACFRTRRGITGANEGEIRKFLAMTPGERSAKRAAQELFASLSNGSEYVTVEQLERRMREIYKLQKKRKKSDIEKDQQLENGQITKHLENDKDQNIDGSSKSTSPARIHPTRNGLMNDNSQISEANLLSAAFNYSNGQIPELNRELTLSVPHQQSLDHVPCLHRPFFHPAMFFSLLYHRFISIFASFPTDFLVKFQVIIVLLAYAIISTENFFSFLPTTGYFVTLAVMVITSFKMLKSKHEFIDFRIWSGLFLSYDEHVAADDSESLFLRNNMKPYFWFFVAFACNLMIYPFISGHWLPHSEITIVAFVFTFITMFCFMYTASSRLPDFMILFSFGLNVLAKYPYEMDNEISKWRFLDLKIPGFSTFVIGNGIEFSMNCRGMLYLAIPVFMFFLAKRRNWQGIFQFLIPHCVTLAWLQISIVSSQSATTFGLMRSALGLAGILLFLPLFGLVTLLIPVFAAVEWLSLTDSTNRIFVTISTTIIAIIGSCFMAISNRTGRYVTFVQILLCILASYFLFRPYMTGDQEQLYSSYLQQSTESKLENQATEGILDVLDDAGTLNWEMYYKYCQTPAWSHTNRINTQIRCSHLDGTNINWNGVVSDVEIRNARNWRRDLIQNYLPLFLSNQILCYFGDVSTANCFEGEICEIKDFIDGQKKCNLDKWNVYEYEMEVKMASSLNKGILNLNTRQESKVIIRANHIFGNFTQRINSSDKIWFKGILKSSLTAKSENSPQCSDQNMENYKSRKHTFVELTSIGCLHCTDKHLKPVSIKGNVKIENRLKDLQRALKYLLNVIFNPLVTFK